MIFIRSSNLELQARIFFNCIRVNKELEILRTKRRWQFGLLLIQ